MSRGMKFIGLGFLILAAAIWVFMALVSSEGGAQADSYESAKAEKGNIESVVAATGAVRPVVTVALGSELSGKITALYADFNDEVKKGQVVAVIDPRSFAARAAQARADLALAEASLKNAQALISKAQANLKKAQRDYERSRRLAKQGNVSESVLDAAIAALDAAKADLVSAQAQKITAEASIDQRKAALEQAEIDLERTQIRAPIDGVIVNRAVDVGQTVAASLSAPVLFDIAQDLRSIQIEASVDEADIGHIDAGDHVRFSVDAYPDRKFYGVVKQVRLAPVELQNVVTYTVIITATNADRKLLPGMTANLEIITGSRENILRVPNEALRFQPPVGAAAQAAIENDRQEQAAERMKEMAETLGLSEDQQSRLRVAVAEMRQNLRSAADAGPSSEPAMAMAQFRAHLAKAMAQILTPGQMEKYKAMQAGRERVRPAKVWTLDSGGKLVEKRIFIGLSDNRYTEVVRGLQLGEQVALRQRAGG